MSVCFPESGGFSLFYHFESSPRRLIRDTDAQSDLSINVTPWSVAASSFRKELLLSDGPFGAFTFDDPIDWRIEPISGKRTGLRSLEQNRFSGSRNDRRQEIRLGVESARALRDAWVRLTGLPAMNVTRGCLLTQLNVPGSHRTPRAAA